MSRPVITLSTHDRRGKRLFPRSGAVLRATLLLVLWLGGFLVSPAAAQPFDLIVPEEANGDTLSNELRQLQNIERDIQLERLTQPVHKFDALVEMGNLRLEQGRLEEAQMYFEQALAIQPENMLANKGLAMVFLRQGKFGQTKAIFDRLTQLYPLSDALRENLEAVRSQLNSTAEIGVRLHEDNAGQTEFVTGLEAYYPSFTNPKLSARYRLETWAYEDRNRNETTDSRLLSGTLEYALDHRSRIAATFAPETFTGGKTIGGYRLHGVTGNSQLHLAAFTGRGAYKENLDTARLQMSEEYATLTVFGDLHERTRLQQSFTTADISDGNARRRFDTEILHFINRHGTPFLSLQLRLSQASFENQLDALGNAYTYWAPRDFRGAEMLVGWERGVGSNWWWGFDTRFVTNSWRNITPDTYRESGVGLTLHASYRFDTGRIHAEFGNTLRDFTRERMLGVYGSFDF